MSNFFLGITNAARAHGEAIAIECQDGPSVSYSELWSASAGFAGALRELGAGTGERVLVQVEKSHAVVELYLAVLRCGAVYLPLNTSYTDAELTYFIEDAEPRVAVVEPTRLEHARNALKGRGRAVTLDELRSLAAKVPPFAETVDRRKDDLAAVLYTSGTTGRSKGAMLTHGNLESNARVLVETWGFTQADVLVHALPIYHVHGLFVALHCALLSGARTLFLPRFELGPVHRALERATVFMGVPTYYTRLLAAPDFPPQGADLRLWISGSAPLRVETFDAFEARTGARILERYGMTEAGMITSNPLWGPRQPGTVGRALRGIAVRVRAEGRLLGPNEPGVLEIRGPNVFAGYWRNPEKTREAFTDDGWFVTGDVATIDESGVVTLVGREKDLIITGGLNVYPKEVEDTLDALDGVRESAVIGVPHADLGEAVIAVVDAERSSRDEARLIIELRRELAGFKVPKRVIFVDELPRNPMGKVQKAVLRVRYERTFAS